MHGQISAITRQKKNQRRVNVYLDDVFAFGLSDQVAAGLIVGQHLSGDEIATLQCEDAYHSALDISLYFLQARPRSCWEVEQRLRKKGFDTPAIEQAVQRLKELDLLDDRMFAKQWIENRDTFRPRSQQLLRQELRRKGVADPIIAELLDDRESTDLQAARRLASMRTDRFREADRDEIYRKLGGYLGRRGFSWSTVRVVLDEVWDSISTGKDTPVGINVNEEEAQ